MESNRADYCSTERAKAFTFHHPDASFSSVLPRRETNERLTLYLRRQRAGSIFFNCGIGCWPRKPMSLLGQKLTRQVLNRTSALPLKADSNQTSWYVSNVPNNGSIAAVPLCGCSICFAKKKNQRYSGLAQYR